MDKVQHDIPLPPTGNKLNCKGWHQEAALRCLLNNLHPDVAEDREHLIVYGGNGQAARDETSLFQIIKALKNLENNETLLIQSGKPVAVFKSPENAPRVVLANSNLVGSWATWEHFHELKQKNLIMYGQMTAGSWIYIGSQGILQGTYETFMAAAEKHYGAGSTLQGKIVASAGLGGMGGAQPLAVKMSQGVFLGCDVDLSRIEKRIKTKYLDVLAKDFSSALQLAIEAKKEKKAISIGVVGDATDFLEFLIKENGPIDLVTDQTSAHDPLYGYVPRHLSFSEACNLRKSDPQKYTTLSYESMKEHVTVMQQFQQKGAHVFDYGNNLREGARRGGHENAFSFPGFVPAYIRDLFCTGNGPFRFVALSGDENDIHVLDDALLKEFPSNKKLALWLEKAREMVSFQGLPSRICWLNFSERKQAALLFNRLVREKKVSAPIVIGRDHLDSGSVASPHRETESMRDDSDAVADWPILNLLINSIGGASWTSFHHGGGVGMGQSLHAGMVIVADGSQEMDERLERVLTSDPGMGIVRHFDAGYPIAQEWAQKHHFNIPSSMELNNSDYTL